MNLTSHHLLTRAILACNKDIGIGCGDMLHNLADALHLCTLAPIHLDTIFGGRSRLCTFLRLLLGCLVGILERGDKFRIIPRLDDKVESTLLHSFNGQFDIGISGKENYLYFGIFLLDLTQPIDTLVTCIYTCVEVHVEQNHIGSKAMYRGNKRVR